MEELFNLYSNKVVKGTDESKMFSKFFKEDRNYVEKWVDKQMEVLQCKNNNKADELRCLGNKLYVKKEFSKSLELYTKALCNATPESESYALILANRSAVFYMIEDYEACLKDINLSLKCNCPENIRLKVFIRKIKCCSKKQLKDHLDTTLAEALYFLEIAAGITNKDKIKEEIVAASNEKPIINRSTKNVSEELPKLKDGTNNNFLCASAAIQLSYDEDRGRHVVAKKQLEIGDVLFIEEPFIFAPVFINENMELSHSKCYHCLRTTFSCIPCKYCIRCIFCDETCRDQCWDEFHNWECVGMQANLWYHIGIAFPALRALIKGIKSGLCTLESDHKADASTYGNECANYGYFNKLISNIPKMTNVLPLIISATVVVLYLKKKTDFFKWLMEQPYFSGKEYEELAVLVGSRITKHIAQLQCNSSVINHKNVDYTGCELSSEDIISVACAIYPSVSMMNHSCKPNISMYYIRGTVVAEAAEEIQANEEIFNCYGIDYRYADWETRQEHCSNLYYFKCRCRACQIEGEC